MTIKRASLFSLITLVHFAQACGPWLPASYVLRNDDVFYAPPEVGFAAELRHLLPDSVPHDAVLEAEALGGGNSVVELRASLSRVGVEGGEADSIVIAYVDFREQLNRIKRNFEVPPASDYNYRMDESDLKEAPLDVEALVVPAGLPDEFRLYLEGALAYYQNDRAAALDNWKAVLDLPEFERRYRSVMAAYMIAKACPGASLKYFPMVRDFAEAGYPDPQGLAAASYGRQARHYLDRSQYHDAIDLYLLQWASGYWNAAQSLERVAQDVWSCGYDAHIRPLVRYEASRAVLTAYLLTQSNDERAADLRQRFLEMLPDVDTVSISEAGRFALMEYQRNHLSAARLWVSYAAADDALALWVKSKLLLRSGRIDEGRTLMMALTEEMKAKGDDWRRLDTSRAWGELGLLMLRDQRYVEAADSFWNASSWEDCAYILERLLTADELIEWVGRHPSGMFSEMRYYDGEAHALLARRLMREARFDQALEYFEPEVREWAESYMQAMRQASDAATDAAIRARHYWEAACILREHGMSLLGAELAPDHVWTDGYFDWGDLAHQRRQRIYTESYEINEPSWSEIELAEKTQILPSKRYHYRYRAVRLAELAAGLLPNNDEQAARIYCVAGSWIKYRDPTEADRLYKQLVVRCPETELGQAASAMNWFPHVDLDTIQPFAEPL